MVIWQGKPGHGMAIPGPGPFMLLLYAMISITSHHGWEISPFLFCFISYPFTHTYIYINAYTYIFISNSHAPPSPPSPAPVGLNEFQTPVVHNDLVSLVTILIRRNQPIVHFEDPLTSQNPPEVRWSCTTGETNGSLNTK